MELICFFGVQTLGGSVQSIATLRLCQGFKTAVEAGRPGYVGIQRARTAVDGIASFSNSGVHSVHLGAPGQEVLSTLPGNAYGIDSGTSMAAPHVTGAAALLAANNSGLDWRAIKNLLLAGGDDRSSLAQTTTGKRLNLYGSMTCSGKTVTRRLQPTTDQISGAVGSAIISGD
jgi:subtilisin family serine protease